MDSFLDTCLDTNWRLGQFTWIGTLFKPLESQKSLNLFLFCCRVSNNKECRERNKAVFCTRCFQLCWNRPALHNNLRYYLRSDLFAMETRVQSFILIHSSTLTTHSGQFRMDNVHSVSADRSNVKTSRNSHLLSTIYRLTTPTNNEVHL